MISCKEASDVGLLILPRKTLPIWKRILDGGIVLFLVPVLLPLMALISLLIKLVSPGPVLFRQPRVGFMGRRFDCLKFRTMHVHTDSSSHQQHLERLMNSNAPLTKLDIKGDPRLIPLGRFLRATGLDELPQLVNVMRGEMSLVGPRPCTFYEYEKYETWHKQRCYTLPGLTGLWQISGKNHTTFNEMIRLDLDYIQRQSLFLDLKILFLTTPVLFSQLFEMIQIQRTVSKSTSALLD